MKSEKRNQKNELIKNKTFINSQAKAVLIDGFSCINTLSFMENLFEVCEVKLSYRTKQKTSERPKVSNSFATYQLLLRCFDLETIELKESFKVLLMNNSNRVLGVMTVADGGTSCVSVDVRLIMQSVLLSAATQIVIAHNHPSGNVMPSVEDSYITSRVKEACKIMNIELCDHLIITEYNYYSFGDNGKL